MALPELIWKRLSWLWVFFFILSGSINLYVAFNYETNTWVNFKLFGLMGMTLIFIIAQGIYISRYIQEPHTKAEAKPLLDGNNSDSLNNLIEPNESTKN